MIEYPPQKTNPLLLATVQHVLLYVPFLPPRALEVLSGTRNTLPVGWGADAAGDRVGPGLGPWVFRVLCMAMG